MKVWLAICMVAAGPQAEGSSSPAIDVVVEASQPAVSTEVLLTDLAHEAALALELEVEHSPVVLARVAVAPSVPEGAARVVRTAFSDALTKSAGLREMKCFGCSNLNIALDTDDLILTQGEIESTGWSQGLRESGAEGLVIMSLARVEREEGERWSLTTQLVDAQSARIVRTHTALSDPRRAALGLDPARLISVREREARYRAAIPDRGGFGQALLWGYMRVPVETDLGRLAINGLALNYRLYDVSGRLKSFMFGVQVGGFIDPSFSDQLASLTDQELPLDIPVSGGLVTGIFGYTLPLPNLRLPRIRFVIEVGGFFGGSLGNEAVLGGALEMVVRHRLGMRVAAIYIDKSDLSELFQTKVELGGLSYMVGGTFNWD